MTEPVTEAGNAMLNDPRAWWVERRVLVDMIAAIEREAAAQAEARVAALQREFEALTDAWDALPRDRRFSPQDFATAVRITWRQALTTVPQEGANAYHFKTDDGREAVLIPTPPATEPSVVPESQAASAESPPATEADEA